MSAVWEVNLPATEKLVLLALADNANDEGHCWPSAMTIARKCGQGERTVRRAIQSLIEKRHISQQQRTGTSAVYTVHPCRSGTTANAAPLSDRPQTPAAPAPKPSGTVVPKKDKPSLVKRAKPKIPLPDDFQPRPFTPGTICAGIVEAWRPGRIERELSKFKDHHLKTGAVWADWDAAWRTWVQNAGDFERGNNGRQPANSLRGTRPDPSLDMLRQAERELAAERGYPAFDSPTRIALPSFGPS
jgi:helix-turn-helix protein